MQRLQSISTLVSLTASFWVFQSLQVTAQIIPDNSLGNENSVVVPNQNIRGINSDRIDGGAIRGSNLFHSFQEFNIDNGRGAYFANPEAISNILSRVTGNNLSNILGTLGVLGNANLFLINPNGIVFGSNARLDVGGSFFASTADSILFENGVEFAASNPDAPPLLTINIPIGLNLRENPGSIVNQSIAVDSEDNFVGLQVLPQKALGLVGGDIQIEGGILTAPQGRIELGSVAENSTVNLTPVDQGYALGYENVQNFQDIALSQGAFIDVQGEGGGDIQIQGRRVTLTGGSVIEASTLGSEAGGVLTIQASESVEVFGGGIFVDVNPYATAIGGSIVIDTPRLLVQDGAFISTSIFGNGNGGNLTVNATDIELVGTESGLDASIQHRATGQGGTLTINTQRLLVRDGAQVLASTFGSGDGGNLIVNATDVELVGTSADTQFPSSIGASVAPGAIGQGGNLTIDTQRLSVQNGAQIGTDTSGNGDGGNLTVTATDIELVGTSVNGQFPSGLGASVAMGATGNAGTLSIDTQRLLVRDGAQITAGTFGTGDGGAVTITATDIELVGAAADGQFPSGLEVSVQAGATGNGGALNINTQRLLVQDGAQIITSTSGNGNGGNLTITATDIELTGARSGLRASSQLGARGNGGTITLNTQRLLIQDRAQILTSTFGSHDGGNLRITAKDVELSNLSLISASVAPGGTGNGGTITLNTQRLLVQDGAQIGTGTFGNGDAGNLTVTATNVELAGTSADGQINSQLATSVAPRATGNAGALKIDTQNLLVRDGAQVSAATLGNGDGGSLSITATDIELVGISVNGQFPSGLATLVAPGAIGDAGTLSIDTQRLRVQDGAKISADTFGNGDGGSLSITATDIELFDTPAAGQLPSTIGTSVEPGAIGKGGTLTIETQRLFVRDGAQISVATFGDGEGGKLTVTAEDIELIGTSTDGQVPSVLGASVEGGATGNGGTLAINTRNLLVRDGAQISTGTFGRGDGGNLTVNATDVELIGTTLDSQGSSGLFTSATFESTGQAGELRVNAENLTVRDGARIDVRSESTEAAGNLIINAPNILLDNQASLNGETTAGQGNITLNTSDLRLRNNSNITTNATGEATGGNITINTETLTALENSDISANAEDAFGGRIIINAAGVFGTAFRDRQTRFSDITATSELGPEFSGTVELNTELDPSSGLIDLTQTVVDPSDLIAQEFCRQRGESEFVVTGRGGIAADPNDKADGNQINVDLVEPVPSQPRNSSRKRSETEDNQAISSLDIIPARGWIRDENGDVILVSYDPTKTGVRRQPSQLPQCQPDNLAP